MTTKEVMKESMKWWIIKFVLICLAVFTALCLCMLGRPCYELPEPITDEYYFEDGILEAEYVTVRDAITTNSIFAVNAAFDDICIGDDDQSLNILDIELKDNKLTIYKVHGDPIIIPIRGES